MLDTVKDFDWEDKKVGKEKSNQTCDQVALTKPSNAL